MTSPGKKLRELINGLETLQQKSLATGEIIERPELAVSFEKLNDVLGFKQFEALEQRFLTKEQLQAKYG